MKRISFILIITVMFLFPASVKAQKTHNIGVQGTRFVLDGQPFDFFGISFFNALYNPTFNKNDSVQCNWLKKLKSYGITVLRIWAQYDNQLGFADACQECSLYKTNGELRPLYLQRLKNLLQHADSMKMVIELALFSRESWIEDIRLSEAASIKAIRSLSRELQPYRNLVFQIWNEHDWNVLSFLAVIRQTDSARLVTNSPGYAGKLGSQEENEALDFLTPHTTRKGRHWETAQEEIRQLIQKYNKPVVDDEPARTGTRKFGGPENESYPYDHILHIYNVWHVGGFVIYHHDMFQTGYGSSAVPSHGIPDLEHGSYHPVVLKFLQVKNRYINR